MEPLHNQAQFESVIWRPEKPSNTLYFVYFTATWCGACKRLDLDAIVKLNANNLLVKYFKCDADENDYTSSYCQVKSLPTFIAFYRGKILDRLSSSNTDSVKAWMNDCILQTNTKGS